MSRYLNGTTAMGRKNTILLLCYVFFVGMSCTIHCVTAQEASTCLANPEFNQVFVDLNGGSAIPLEGSCCQKDVCNLPCPATSPEPGVGYGIGVGFVVVVSFVVGLMTCVFVGSKSENYFVAGHALPTWIVAVTLGAAAVDSNSLLGNIDLSYKFSFYDGAGTFMFIDTRYVIPIHDSDTQSAESHRSLTIGFVISLF
jgi:hypothetical protein